MKTNHKYRVNVYLGKELYTKMDNLSKDIGVPLASMLKMLINLGVDFADNMGGKFNG